MSPFRAADPRAPAADLSIALPRTLPDRQTRTSRDSPLAVLTVGHSTRPFEEFLALLSVQAVTRLVDVRTYNTVTSEPTEGCHS